MWSFLKARLGFGSKILAALCFGLIFAGSADGALVYWQNFEGGDGLADTGVGDLGITNTGGGSPGNTVFSSTGGIFGGSYDATSNVTANNSVNFNGITSTGAAGGTALSALPNSGTLNQFTVSMWVKTQTISNNSGRAGRLLTLGASGTTDILNVNSFGFVQIASTAALGPTKFAPYFGATDLTAVAGIGADNIANEWTFIAISYDGTSANGDNSVIQNAATGSSINGQFYRGTDVASVVRNDLPFVTTVGTPSSASLGALNLGTSAILFAANRTALTRAHDGWVDDIRIYDSVLTASEIEGVRQQGLAGTVPEPGSIILAVLAMAVLAGRTAKRRKLNWSLHPEVHGKD
jgi:hypothetical protein